LRREEEERLEKEREGGREREKRREGKTIEEKMHVVHICLKSHKSVSRR
jgi:hypothetical protein